MTGLRFDECTFAVIDVETTGIDASRHRIIEVAVLTCDWTGKVLERFETLVRPEGDAAGGRAEMLEDAPAFTDIAGEVVTRLANHVVAGHNVSFDLRFLDAELARLGARLPSHSYVCTRELATVLGCDVANRTLASLCVYFGVPFDRWHTAADDTAATASVLAGLLARAAGFGRVELASVDCRWSGFGSEWPALPTGGRLLARDTDRWPPGGDQPGSRRAKEASFRRLGEGPESPSGAVVSGVSGDDVARADDAGDEAGAGAGSSEADGDATPRRSANEVWWQGDFRGLEGITQLQDVVLPAFRDNDDPELAKALMAMADLLRRHGGRDAEVRATLSEAYEAGLRRGDWAGLVLLVDQWWAYLAALRDTDGLVELLLRCADSPMLGDPIERLRTQIVRSRGTEPLVADQLARRAITALAAGGQQERAWDALALLVDTLDETEGLALLEEAWTSGCQSPAILDRLSDRLERAARYEAAAEVCARGLATPASPGTGGVVETLRKRHRRCQQRLAEEATLFG